MSSQFSRRSLLRTGAVTPLAISGAFAKTGAADERPPSTWSRTYRPDDGRYVSVADIAPGTGDGYVLAGSRAKRGLGSARGWVAGVDAAGRVEWQRTLGVPVSFFQAVVPAPDSGAVLVGSTNGPMPLADSREHTDPWAVRIDGGGDVRWSRTYQSDAAGGRANAVAAVPDGYVIAGALVVDDHLRPWAIRHDHDGSVRWQWRSADEDRTGAVDAVAALEDGIAVVGSDRPDRAESYRRRENAWVVRLDSTGDEAWRRRFETEDAGDRIEALVPGPDGGVVVLGQRGFHRNDHGEAWLASLGASGETKWERTYPRETRSEAAGLAVVDDGYVLVGTRESADDSARGAWLVRVDSGGEPRWEDVIADDADTDANAIHPVSDGGLLVGGDRDDELGWLAKFGGDPSETKNGSIPISLPTVPDWTAPLLVGTGIGTVLGRMANRARDDD